MSLHDDIVRQIARLGPMSVAEYMTQCLYHPTKGYYTTTRPIGAQGDFVTAPEVSQMFGELIGLWLAQVWLDQGRPDPFVLAELGPGRGQLMSDALRAARGVPGFLQAARLTLVEVNTALRAQQAEQLGGFDPVWIKDVADLPEGPLFLVANEFFDCLPISQYIRGKDGWHEQVIAAQDGKLHFARRPAGAVAESLPMDWPRDVMLELCPAANALTAAIAERVASGGAALIIDYGATGQGGDTFQAVRGHEPCDPLSEPGQTDLTAHVDFSALEHSAASCASFGPTPQGMFLERLGITARAQTLAKGMNGAKLESHIAAHRRLTHPDEMGEVFKAFAILPPSAAPPPGFDP